MASDCCESMLLMQDVVTDLRLILQLQRNPENVFLLHTEKRSPSKIRWSMVYRLLAAGDL